MVEGHGRQKLKTAWQSKAKRERWMTVMSFWNMLPTLSPASSLVWGRAFMSLISIKP